MIEIFSSPELRVLWTKPETSKSASIEIDHFFSQLVDVKGFRFLFEESIDIETNDKEKSKKWYELLFNFKSLVNQLGPVNSSNYLAYSDFFKNISRFPVTNSKEISFQQKETLLAIKSFKDAFKLLVDDLRALEDNFELYKKWVSTISELFLFINSHYFKVDGFSFSDLEYYVLQGLKKPEILAKIQESFSYFIIDEFQDTSFIQFEILKMLIAGKTEKIFCVGDRKQAIYGFRGGELQVFADCAQLLGTNNNYFLKNNFRSFSSIIEFNNNLFEQVFPLGVKFEGVDPHSVLMEAQINPNIASSEPGEVIALRTEITGDSSEMNLDQLEAKVLSEHLVKLLADERYKTICILYRKLKPSRFLIDNLLDHNIAFGAQVKIQFSDDPLMNIFLYLIELKLNQKDPIKKASTLFLLQALLDILEVKKASSFFVDQFLEDIKLLGLRLSFHKFIYAIGLSNSAHTQNADLIDSICRLTKEDLVGAYHLLKTEEGEDYAIEMMSGESAVNNNKRIIIMSAHASKGLEFDAVLLGGVHTNGRYNGMKDHVGKLPHSFKWKKTFDQKRFFKSPFYHLESEILCLKDFSESKRLLYVACTRAVKHLAYADLWSLVNNSSKDLFNSDNSWIHALRLNQTPKIEASLFNMTERKVETSLVQRDSLGMLASQRKSSYGLISELSVTRLASIADCPFKFYLQNICKIEMEKANLKIESKIKELDDEEFEIDESFYSSKKRGTEIHSFLSKLFLGETTLALAPKKELDKISWAQGLSSRFQNNYEIISERLIKFSFFGQMISGTPDLVFIERNQEVVVWDFKTGLRHPEDESSYWFQLMSYAFAYAKLAQFTPDKKVELSLLYLDQKEIVTKSLSLAELTQALFVFWKKTESLDQVNLKHCPSCQYSSICRKSEKSTPMA
jgi:ATP-dependent exoDNAse (exonuclease V) beta subunit